MKYDICQREGVDASVTVFAGGNSYIATEEHPNFATIIKTLRDGVPYDTSTDVFNKKVVGLFDLGVGLSEAFTYLSERVTITDGRIFFDGDEVNDGLSQTIVRFYAEHNEDFWPFVLFMEKIAGNPNEHSRQHLFRWLGKHRFAIAPDGDFYAYKGVNGPADDLRSITSGRARVNGVRKEGKIPNHPGTVIEMPRSQVTFDPRNGCSTGLHAGSWDYARSFGPTTLRVKINPRDVVSVPTDSADAKLRVCRYRVDTVVKREDDEMLFIGDPEKTARMVEKAAAPPKPAAAKPAKKGGTPVQTEMPTHYEDFTAAHFRLCAMDELRWLAKEWDVTCKRPVTKPRLANALARRAAKRRKELA